MTGAKILIVDDEQVIRTALRIAFLREGMKVEEAEDGLEAEKLLQKTSYDLIILDVMMQDMDGYTFLQRIRSANILTPVLMLSGKTEETDQVLGLGLGADDYLTKPFQLPVLIQKVKALIRRNRVYSHQPAQFITVGPFTFDLVRLICMKNGEILNLTARELALFRFFMENPGQVFTKDQIYRQVWDEYVVDDNTIMVYIKRLREKIEDDGSHPVYLKTIRGVGYRFYDR